MAFKPIGTVSRITGEASAIDDKGNSRYLKPGDPVYYNEIIRTAEQSIVEIRFIDGSLVDFSGQSDRTLDNKLFDSASIDLGNQADIEALQAAIEAGRDPTEITEAPAAGPAEENDGSDIVQVEYNDPRATPVNGFDTSGIAVQFTEPIEELLLDPEAEASLPSQGSGPNLLDPQDTVNDQTVFDLTGTVVQAEGTDVFSANPTEFIFSVSRSGDVSQAGSVNYSIASGNLGTVDSTDFVNPDLLNDAFTLNFEAGETEKLITIGVNPDPSSEPIESFTVNLSNPTGATDNVLVSNGSATGVILDDDAEDALQILTITPNDVLSDPSVMLELGGLDPENNNDPRVQLTDISSDNFDWQNDPVGGNPTDYIYGPITVEIGPTVIVDIV